MIHIHRTAHTARMLVWFVFLVSASECGVQELDIGSST